MAVADVVAGDAEESGGGGDVASGLVDGAPDEFVDGRFQRKTFLREIEIRGECAARRRFVGRRSRRAGERGEVPLVAFLEHDRSLEFVAEFADVARPSVVEQPRLAVGADRLGGDPVAAG